MGDRTQVTLTFPTELLSLVEQFPDHAPDDQWGDDFLTNFSYSEINYGDLQFLEDLQAAGIPHDSEWERGDQYGPGTEYCRFSPEGELKIIQVYNKEINPNIDSLMESINDHEALKKLILRHKDDTTPLPWDDQVKFGKMYRTRQLIHA